MGWHTPTIFYIGGVKIRLLYLFIDDCRLRGLTDRTLESYKSNIRFFLNIYPDPLTIDINDLRSLLLILKEKDLKVKTIKTYFSNLSSFYDFLVFDELILFNPISTFVKRYVNGKYIDSENRQLISIDNVHDLISLCPSILDRALILTLAKTGMRRGELLGLKIGDIDLERRTIKTPVKAKRTNRVCFIDDELNKVLLEYIAEHGDLYRKNDIDWFWISTPKRPCRTGRVHRDYINNMLSGIGQVLGIHEPGGPLDKRLTCHCFRHFFTTSLFRSGMRSEYIMFLRGDSLGRESWHIYNHLDYDSIREEYLSCIPTLL